jgi:hypothetical protein
MSSPQNLETEANQDYQLEPHINPKFCTKCEYVISTFEGAINTKERPPYEDSSLIRASAEDGCHLCGQILELIECTEIKEPVPLGLSIWSLGSVNFDSVLGTRMRGIWKFLYSVRRVSKLVAAIFSSSCRFSECLQSLGTIRI